MHLLAATLPLLCMTTPTVLPPGRVGVLWDVDGTLVESTKLAFVRRRLATQIALPWPLVGADAGNCVSRRRRTRRMRC